MAAADHSRARTAPAQRGPAGSFARLRLRPAGRGHVQRLYESAALLAFSSRVRWPNQAAPSAGQAGPTKAWAQLRSVANLHEKRTQPKSKKKKSKVKKRKADISHKTGANLKRLVAGADHCPDWRHAARKPRIACACREAHGDNDRDQSQSSRVSARLIGGCPVVPERSITTPETADKRRLRLLTGSGPAPAMLLCNQQTAVRFANILREKISSRH